MHAPVLTAEAGARLRSNFKELHGTKTRKTTLTEEHKKDPADSVARALNLKFDSATFLSPHTLSLVCAYSNTKWADSVRGSSHRVDHTVNSALTSSTDAPSNWDMFAAAGCVQDLVAHDQSATESRSSSRCNLTGHGASSSSSGSCGGGSNEHTVSSRSNGSSIDGSDRLGCSFSGVRRLKRLRGSGGGDRYESQSQTGARPEKLKVDGTY